MYKAVISMLIGGAMISSTAFAQSMDSKADCKEATTFQGRWMVVSETLDGKTVVLTRVSNMDALPSSAAAAVVTTLDRYSETHRCSAEDRCGYGGY